MEDAFRQARIEKPYKKEAITLYVSLDTIENGGSECPMPIEEYQPMYQRNQDLWAAVAWFYKSR